LRAPPRARHRRRACLHHFLIGLRLRGAMGLCHDDQRPLLILAVSGVANPNVSLGAMQVEGRFLYVSWWSGVAARAHPGTRDPQSPLFPAAGLISARPPESPHASGSNAGTAVLGPAAKARCRPGMYGVDP